MTKPFNLSQHIARSPINVKDVGARGNGVTDDTAALQAAFDQAKAQGRAVHFPAGIYLVNAAGLNFNFDGGNLLSKLCITGDGPRASVIRPVPGVPRPLFNFTVAAEPTDSFLVISGLSFDGLNTANNHVGIRMTAVGNFHFSDLVIENCATGLDLLGSLVGDIENCTISRNVVGIYTDKSAVGSVYANAISVRQCRLNLNTRLAVSFGGGSQLRLRDSQVEANGTAGDLTTGGMLIEATVDDEAGFAMVVIDGCWFENNKGRALQVQNTAGLTLDVARTMFYSTEGGRAIYVAGANNVSLDRVLGASGAGDIFDITCSRLTMRDSLCYSLAGTQTYPFIENSTIGSEPYAATHRTAISLGGQAGGWVKWAWDPAAGASRLTFHPGTAKTLWTDGAHDVTGEYRQNGLKVVGARQAAIANSGDATVNAILAALRAHGLIAP